MINKSYRLISPNLIRVDFINENICDETIAVRPSFFSICAADQRYYTGSRGKEVMKSKLPMALIHEAVGIVIYDSKGEYEPGDKVVLIPNTPFEQDDVIKENYIKNSKFRASGYDGFMQDIVFIRRDRILKFDDIPMEIASLLELLSVAQNALEFFEIRSNSRKQKIGIWGSGSVGFAVALLLKKSYPQSEIIVFGTNQEKLNYFTFADSTYLVDDVPKNIFVDHAFECVGGEKSETAIDQIINIINPQGSIALLGVSENKISINTRTILEKGITLVGNSRSGKEDFTLAIKFLKENPDAQKYLKTIISEIIEVKCVEDIYYAFNKDLNNKFKTIMKWGL